MINIFNLRRHKCVCLFVCDYESLMLSAYSIDRRSFIKALSSTNKSAQKKAEARWLYTS